MREAPMPERLEPAAPPPPPNGNAHPGGAPGRFPVTVRFRDWAFLPRSLRGWGENLDHQGLRVATPLPVPKGRRVEVQFQPPRPAALDGGFVHDFPARVETVRQAQAPKGGYELSLKWKEPPEKVVGRAVQSRAQRIGFLLCCVLGLTVWLRWVTIVNFWDDPLLYMYSMAMGLFFYSRFILAYFHRPPVASEGYEPTLSIVISVRNEEDGIANGIASCFAADYPADKKEVIVVDDGSTDGTARVLAEVQRSHPELKFFSIPPSGKRQGMAKGIREAKGEIVVVIDSDSILDRDALRHIIRGFEDPSLGAVSGYTGAANAAKNMLTRMQDVRYFVSFELMKAPESVFGCVTCCPGCLSAYRREYLLEVLDPWLKQTFWGVPSTFGDDRSLTNFILRTRRVIYNPLARARTMVPENWGHYMRQQCRWKKSWLRECWNAGRILAGRHPVAALSFYVSALCSVISPLIIFRLLRWEQLDKGEACLAYLAGGVLLGLSMGLFALWKRPLKHWYLVWYWLATQILIMGPQTYYAMLTIRRSHWGTR